MTHAPGALQPTAHPHSCPAGPPAPTDSPHLFLPGPQLTQALSVESGLVM